MSKQRDTREDPAQRQHLSSRQFGKGCELVCMDVAALLEAQIVVLAECVSHFIMSKNNERTEPYIVVGSSCTSRKSQGQLARNLSKLSKCPIVSEGSREVGKKSSLDVQ